jgi:hypothetical protein
VDLPIGSYNDPPSSSTRLLNCYIEKGGPQGPGPVLRGFPGISDYKTVGDGPIRAAHHMLGVTYLVSGGSFCKVDDGVVSVIGDVDGPGRPQIIGNGPQVAILIEPRLWVYTVATGALAEVTDADFPGATSIQFFDNYITYTEISTGRWGSSDLADATSFDGLFFATAEGAPDNLVGHIVDHRQAFLLGSESCELWDNAGISGFPFVRSANGFVEIGCLAPRSACKADQSILWLASDGTVRRLQGATPARVSTEAVERAFRNYSMTEAFGQSFTWDGHVFYVITFPEATWAFDLTTGQWLELQSHGLDNWRVACSVQANGRVYVGDSESNKFGLLDAVYSEWGDLFVMEWTYAPTARPHSCIEIIAKMGVGLATGQGSDPEIVLRKSDDGEAFTILPSRKLGVQGNRKARARWHRLGRLNPSKMRVYGASISDPVERVITGTILT